MIGLKRGVMRFNGMGPDKKWILINASGTKNDLWQVFCHVLAHMKCVRVYAGYGHVFLKRRNNHDGAGVPLNDEYVKEFIKTGNVHDPYLQKIVEWFTAFSTHLNGTMAQSQSDLSRFILKSGDYVCHAKKLSDPNSVGLYLNAQGLCRLEYVRMRNACHIGRATQCIFLLHDLVGEHAHKQNMYYCSKFCDEIAQKKIAEFETENLGDHTRGTCTCLRGFEI